MKAIIIVLGGIFFLYFLAYFYWKLRLDRPTIFTRPILLFHKVELTREWGVNCLRPEHFARLIAGLNEQGFQSVNLEEVASMKPADWGKKVLLTFDDAYQGIYSHALPVLESFGYTAAIFVITGFVGKDNAWDLNLGGKRFKHLTWSQIQELAQRGFSFGSHTVNHPDLTRLSSRLVEFELKKSKEDLEDHLGKEVVYLSYPFGRFNRAVQEESVRQGYQLGFSIYPNRYHSLRPDLALKRFGVYSVDSPLSIRIKLDRSGWFWLEDLKGYLINRLSLGTTLVKKLPDYSGAKLCL